MATIFAKHDDPAKPAPRVEPFVERLGLLIEHYHQVLPPFKAQEFTDLVAKLPSEGARGLDGWKASEIKRLTPCILELFLELFDTVEKVGKWPDELCWVSISLIPQGEGCDPLELRPLTATLVVHKLWAALRTRHSMSWQEQWIHKGQHGARAYHSTTDALPRISMEFERATLNGRKVHGIPVDLSRASDNVSTKITFEVLEKIGMDAKLLRTLQGLLVKPKGCPISVMLLTALMMALHKTFDGDVTAAIWMT